MRARVLFAVASMGILSVAGCANLWGFNDFTLGDAGEDRGDATMPEASTDASIDTPHETSTGTDAPLATDGGGDAGFDGRGGSDAIAGDAGGEPEAEADCGPTTTVVNCGACGIACIGANASQAGCKGASCTYSCMSGWADCDAAPPNTDGCETPLTSPSNCGGCGQACNTSRSEGESCSGGTCTYTNCKPGWADCDTMAPDTDGCETQVPVDASATCGVCGETCDVDSGHSIGATCNAGTCVYSGCAPGWADCNKTPPDTHGCSTPLFSTLNCGACGVACDTMHSVGATCVGVDGGTMCTYGGCETGWANCDMTPPDSNGCETSLSSPSNCGMCGRACDTTTGTPTCDGTTCSYTCINGRANCKTTPPNTDGCECATPGCCGSGCETTHANGVGQSYYDCTTKSTYDQAQATEACAAFTGSPSECTQSMSGLCLSLGGLSASSVCGSNGSTCYCWQYAGPFKGHVQNVQSGGCTAICGTAGDPSWN